MLLSRVCLVNERGTTYKRPLLMGDVPAALEWLRPKKRGVSSDRAVRGHFVMRNNRLSSGERDSTNGLATVTPRQVKPS